MGSQNQREEKWIRMMLDEKLHERELGPIEQELTDDYLQGERYRKLESLIHDVGEYYTETKDPKVDLTHAQKEEIYAHISSVFEGRKVGLRIEWIPQLRFALAVMFGTAALVASVPLFNWISVPEQRPLTYSVDGTLKTYEPQDFVYLPPRLEEPMLEPVEVFDDILLKQDDGFDPMTYEMLPWDRMKMDFGEPALDVPEFDFEESIVNLIDADVAPVPIRKCAPSFPSEARRNHLDGRVIVEFVVDENGEVQKPQIASSNHHIFESAAIEAIRRWEFSPGEKDGEVVKVRMRMPFIFNYRR